MPFSAPGPAQLVGHVLSVTSSESSIVLSFFSNSTAVTSTIVRGGGRSGKRHEFVLVRIPRGTAKQCSALARVNRRHVHHTNGGVGSSVRTRGTRLALSNAPGGIPSVNFHILHISSSGCRSEHGLISRCSRGSVSSSISVAGVSHSSLSLLFRTLPGFRLPCDSGVSILSKNRFSNRAICDMGSNRLLTYFRSDVPRSLIHTVTTFEPHPSCILISRGNFLGDTTHAGFARVFGRSTSRGANTARVHVV